MKFIEIKKTSRTGKYGRNINVLTVDMCQECIISPGVQQHVKDVLQW